MARLTHKQTLNELKTILYPVEAMNIRKLHKRAQELQADDDIYNKCIGEVINRVCIFLGKDITL